MKGKQLYFHSCMAIHLETKRYFRKTFRVNTKAQYTKFNSISSSGKVDVPFPIPLLIKYNPNPWTSYIKCI